MQPKAIDKYSQVKMAPRSPRATKAERVSEYVQLLKSGIEKDELLCHKTYEGQDPEQMGYDVASAWEEYNKDRMSNEAIRRDLMVSDDKAISVKAHIVERAEIAQAAKHDGDYGIALNAVQDMAKLQKHYEEKRNSDSKIEFVFNFRDGLDREGIPGVVLDIPSIALDVKDS